MNDYSIYKLMNLSFLLIFFLTKVSCLQPKKLPNGKPRKFVPNREEPRKDLILISPASASLITKNWISNIVLDVFNKKNSKVSELVDGFEYEDLHIVTNINKLNLIIDETQKRLSNSWTNTINNYDDSLIIFAWKPRCLQGFNEVLFLVIGELDRRNKELVIKYVIQSPFWDDEQIDSIYLKLALIDQNKAAEMTSINFDTLYQENIRFKLAWDTWCIDIE